MAALTDRLPARARLGGRPELWVAAAAASLSVVVNLRHVSHDALWQDEVASARIIQQPSLLDALHQVHQTESTPPLWYVLAWSLHRLGLGIVDVRLLSVLATAGAVVLIVLFARRIVPLPFAGLAGFLVALGPQFAAHAHELRAYALLSLLAVLLAVTLELEVERHSTRRSAALASVVAAGLLTHYFFAFSLLAAIVWLLLDPAARNARKHAAVAMAAGVAAFLPWLPFALSQYHHDRFWWIGRFVFRRVVDAPFRMFTAFSTHGAGGVVAGLTLVIAAVGALLLGRGSSRGRLTAALAFGPLLLAGLAWRADIRIFATRNLLEVGPFMAIAFAGAIAAIPRRIAMLVAASVAAAAVTGYARTQRGSATPFDSIARALAAEGWRPSDPIAVFGNFYAFRSPLEWYLPARPPLALARRPTSTCSTLFVVTPASVRPSVLTLKAGPFTVERLASARAISGVLSSRRAVVLSDPRQQSCAPAVTTGRESAGYGLPA